MTDLPLWEITLRSVVTIVSWEFGRWMFGKFWRWVDRRGGPS